MNEEKRAAAAHEAGHCVIGWIYGRRPGSVEIGSDGEGSTVCQELKADARHRFSPERYRRLAIEEVYVWSAGAIAEEILTGSSDPDAACVDAERVIFWTGELGVRRGDLLARALTVHTKQMLADSRTWTAVRAIAARLLQRGSMTGAEVDELCRSLRVRR